MSDFEAIQRKNHPSHINIHEIIFTDLVISEEAGLYVLAVDLPVDVPDLEVAELPEHALHPRHDVVDEPAGDPLVHRGLLLGGGLHVQELYQRLDRDALQYIQTF